MTARASRTIATLAGAALVLLSARAIASECVAPRTFGAYDPVLRVDLDHALRDVGLGRALDRGALAVSLVDLSRGRERYYAGINDDQMMYAASLPKIAILLAVVDAIERGEHAWSDDIRYRLSEMINISNNAYATWGAELVGLRRIAEVMTNPRYCLYEGGVGGLWVGRGFRKGGAEFREPLKSLSHAATTRQIARFYALLADGALVSRHWSARMLRLMRPPAYRHKFVAALEGRRGVRFEARKSGTWAQFHSDSAMIQHGFRRFIVTALADDPAGGQWMEQIAIVADDLVVRGRHRLRR